MTKILILNVGNGMNKGNLALLYSTLEARRRNRKYNGKSLEEIKSGGGMK